MTDLPTNLSPTFLLANRFSGRSQLRSSIAGNIFAGADQVDLALLAQ
jgi:hypothetical protein